MPHSLQGQFAAALMAMGALVVAGGVTAVYALRATGDAARQVSQERLALVEVAQDLQQHTQQIQLLSDRMVAAETGPAVRRHYEQILRKLDELDQLTARLAVSDDASVLDLHMASQLFRNSAHVISHVRGDASMGGAPEVRAVALASYRDEMQAHALAMVGAARTQSDQLTRAYQAAVQRVVDASHVSAWWVVGWLAFSLLGAWLIARRLLGRHVLARLQQVSLTLRSVDVDVQALPTSTLAAVHGDDEVGQMARAVEQFLRDRRQLALTQARLEEEQQRLAAIIDNTADSIVVLQAGRVRQLNRAAERMFGLRQAEATGLPGEELIPGLDWQAPTLPGVTLDATARSGGGCHIPVEASLNRVAGRAGDLIVLVIRDATLRKEAEQHLIAARDAAVAARAAQAAFLATMSHELRTPLNGVLGYAQILELDTSLSERQALAAETIRRSGEHLLALINDLLDLAKHDAGKLELCLDGMSLLECLRVTSDIIRVKSDQAGLVFRVDVGPDVPPTVLADEKRLRQVLLNLLSNAVKFTDRGEVVLGVHRVGEAVRHHAVLRFEVRDTGVGMPQDQLEKVFQPFEQTGDARRRTVGTGLGLAISRQLVQLMGGDIQVASELGRGTVFSFELEFRVVPPATATATAEAEIVGYEGPRKRVLIVDDLAANRLVMRDLLLPLGFEIDEAADGRRAVERARAINPDLIVMDIAMPVMDGRQAMAAIRQIESLRAVPIIIVSASVDAADMRAVPDLPASTFLPKPVDRELLLREVARLLGLMWRHSAAAAEPLS
ncbi:MAG TPA: ATP-binding protein [Ideonella sp.]|uniref:ATP-binding protein n=1 Tax=Ideonella sp. TaxID=1929293 RepID=UPI002E33599B|nr:ATP-binding protein [Ideonella sp.]HEX5682808.1 ATP-binding protein [Ideonella sp.]